MRNRTKDVRRRLYLSASRIVCPPNLASTAANPLSLTISIKCATCLLISETNHRPGASFRPFNFPILKMFLLISGHALPSSYYPRKSIFKIIAVPRAWLFWANRSDYWLWRSGSNSNFANWNLCQWNRWWRYRQGWGHWLGSFSFLSKSAYNQQTGKWHVLGFRRRMLYDF